MSWYPPGQSGWGQYGSRVGTKLAHGDCFPPAVSGRSPRLPGSNTVQFGQDLCAFASLRLCVRSSSRAASHSRDPEVYSVLLWLRPRGRAGIFASWRFNCFRVLPCPFANPTQPPTAKPRGPRRASGNDCPNVTRPTAHTSSKRGRSQGRSRRCKPPIDVLETTAAATTGTIRL